MSFAVWCEGKKYAVGSHFVFEPAENVDSQNIWAQRGRIETKNKGISCYLCIYEVPFDSQLVSTIKKQKQELVFMLSKVHQGCCIGP